MNLPAEFAAEFQTHAGTAPALVLRALYGLHGALGETYLATNGDVLALFSRPAGKNVESRYLDLPEIHSLSVEPDSIYTTCRIQSNGETLELKFTSWDSAKLDELLQLWKSSNPKVISPSAAIPDSPIPEPVSAATISNEAVESEPPPLVAFCAAIHALASSDGQADPAELGLLSRLIRNPSVVRRGAELLQDVGVEQLPAQLKSRLDVAQKRCLMANMISVAMVDGVLRSCEHELLNLFREGIDFDASDYATIYGVLMLKNNVALFAEQRDEEAPWRDEDTLTPLVALCASLYAMLQVDEHAHELEWLSFNTAVHDAGAVERGVRHYQTYGVDFLLSVLPDLLNREQKRCLYANLLRVAMADQMLRSSERELLGRFQSTLDISDQEHEAIYAVLLVKLDVSVFESETSR